MSFGSKQERLAKVLHDAKMKDCWGNWQSAHRFAWPETREQWTHYQHNPHPVIEYTMAQARAALAHFEASA